MDVEGKYASHAACDPSNDPATVALRDELMGMILWADANSERSLQQAIGPSEIGHECDRRIAYRLLETKPCNNNRDPWPAIVGTAVHAWLEKAVNSYQAAHGGAALTFPWVTETTVQPDAIIEGHCDLYRPGLVVDWKTAGPDVIKKIRRASAPPASYRTQVHVYGYGHVRAGRPVDHVALVFLPRSGWLDGMYVWREPYDEAIAIAAIERVYAIGGKLLQGLSGANIPATPGDHCGFCPWFRYDSVAGVGADEYGCTGRQ
jgi:hypothetical protein